MFLVLMEAMVQPSIPLASSIKISITISTHLILLSSKLHGVFLQQQWIHIVFMCLFFSHHHAFTIQAAHALIFQHICFVMIQRLVP